METILPFLTGPYGGIMAIVGSAGFMAGYSFANRTVLKAAIERIEESKEEIDVLKSEVRRWQRLYFKATGKSDHAIDEA